MKTTVIIVVYLIGFILSYKPLNNLIEKEDDTKLLLITILYPFAWVLLGIISILQNKNGKD